MPGRAVWVGNEGKLPAGAAPIDYGLPVIALVVTIAAGKYGWGELASGRLLRALGLAIVLSLYRIRKVVRVDDANLMKE